MVLVVGDEGGVVLDRLTGRRVDRDAREYAVSETLFERTGRLALITGIGQDWHGSGLAPGGSIVAPGRTYDVIFSLEGLCIATIREKSSARRPRKEGRRPPA